MLRRRARRLLATVRRELHDALRETHTPRQVAASFALGIFITALPTLGTGVLAFFVIAYLFENVSKVALFASVVVLNPVLKWGVYGASFWLGSELLGPAGVSVSTLSLSAGPAVVERLLVGNLVLATGFTLVAYVGSYRLTVEYRRRTGDVGILERAFERAAGRVPGWAGPAAAPGDDASPDDAVAAGSSDAVAGDDAAGGEGPARDDVSGPGTTAADGGQTEPPDAGETRD